jgi:hypothetical protein
MPQRRRGDAVENLPRRAPDLDLRCNANTAAGQDQAGSELI